MDSLPAELPGKANEAIYVIFTGSVILNGEKLKEKKNPISKITQIYSLSSLLFNIVFKVLAMAIEEKKKHLNWKRRRKTVIVCRWHGALHSKS